MPREYLIDDDDAIPADLPDVPYGGEEPEGPADESEDE